ncbi:ATP-binding protein [Streptomyces sp. NPDC058657]|uniref:ATP-binding protein n=1 Tax=unclassified Streptomyces TaxID=2593676 RepID=UPI003653ABCF
MLTAILCPTGVPARTTFEERDGLALSLTVPGQPRSAGIVRAAISGALHAHHLDRYGPITTLAATELISVSSALTCAGDAYVSLRHRDDTLRLIVWDQHPPHAEPDAASLCFVRRRRALWLLDEAVEDWGGEWGVGDALPPHRGVKSWVTLPR